VSDYRGYFVCDSNNALISPDIVKIHSGSDYEFDTWLWAQEAPMVSRYPRIELPDPFLIGHVWNGRANEKFGVAERIDWKPCQAVTDKFQPEVTKYNMEHKNKDGFEIMLTCEYSGDPKIPRKPKRKVNLTASEIEHLHGLRKIRDAAYEASEAYESYLFRVHHERQPKPGDPCFYYAGIVVDTDYLTIDPNPMFYGDDCQ
jgi:hypothetical protein